MARPGVTIYAPVLAAPVVVDGLIETNIGGIVPRDDGPGGVRRHRGAQRRQVLVEIPTVIDGEAHVRFEPAGRVADRAAAFEGLGRQRINHVERLVSRMRTNQEQIIHKPLFTVLFVSLFTGTGPCMMAPRFTVFSS